MTGLFCSSPRVQKKLQKWFSSFAIFSLFLQIFSGVFAYQPVIAEEGTEIPQETVIVSENTPTPEVTPNSETTPIIEAPTEVIPTPVEEVTPTPIIEENVPPAENSAPPNETSPPLDLEKPIEDPSSGQIAPIPTQAPSQWTFEKVELDKEYIAPQNSGVKLTFTGLPNPSGNIKIEEITLTSDQIKQTGSLSDKAYDITSDMKDGDFTYNLSLPIPESSKGEAVEVKSAEELSNIGSAAKVENTLTKTDTSVSVTSLDHFTIFVVSGLTASATMILVDSLQANWGTGVYSAYYTGPYASRTVVSPGDTTVYGGREAGIIKAGFVTAEPWDEGILAFKVPNVAISTFAGQVLAYDVQNESGSNPVWVRIRLVGGTQYQFVPSSYSAGVWNTVNAATGEWQLMDGDGNATGSLMTLSGVATANPGAQVDRVYLTLGMGNSYNVSPGVGTVGWVDKVTIGGITYDFITTGEIPTSCTGASITPPVGTTVCYLTIQAAIDAATSGETINVAAGTYPERIVIDKPLNLIGAVVGVSIIDATSFGTQGDVIKITTLTGNTKIEGFDIKTGDYNNGITSSDGTDASGKIEIKNNHIISTNVDLGDNNDQFGIIAGYGDVRKLIISGNTITNTYDNSILIEKQAGETEVTSNTLEGAFPSVFFMTYSGLDVTALQKVNNNIINMAVADPTWYGSAITFNGAHRNEPLVSLGLGKYTNISITGNTIQNLSTGIGSAYKGINLVNDDPTGTGGEITGAIISGNQISGATGNNAVGIKLSGKITGTVLSNNTIKDLSVGLLGASNNNGVGTQYPSTTIFSDKNSLSGNTVGVNWPSQSSLLNATNNWWGNASGPLDNKTLSGTPNYNNPSGTGNSVTSYVDYKPWFTNSEMTTLSSANATTRSASDITLVDATLEGTNGSYYAIGHSFWVSLNTFSTASSTIPADVYSTVDLGAIAANADFSVPLTSVTGLPTVTPNTMYYFAAWSSVDGTWYPGEILTFTTAADLTAPVITGTPSDITVEATSASGATVTYTNPTATDNVDPTVLVTCVLSSGSTFPLGTTAVTCSATDVASNTSTSTFNVTVQDTTPPTIPVLTSPINGVVTSNNALLMQWDNSTDIVGSGVAGYEYQVYYNCSDSSNVPGSCSSHYYRYSPLIINSELQGGATPDGTYYWQVRAKDNTGNFSNWSGFEKVIIDTAPPIDPGVPSTTPNPTNSSSQTWNWITSSDLNGIFQYAWRISGGLSGTVLGTSTTTNLLEGIWNFFVKAIDNAGNQSSEVSSSVQVDTTAPVITGTPSDMIVEADSASGATVSYTVPTVTDNYDSDFSATCSPFSGTVFAFGATVVTCDATDTAGNNASQTAFTVTVVDTTAPLAPAITSSSHVLSTWNQDRTIAMNWSATDFSGINGYSYQWSQTAGTIPNTDSEGNVTTMTSSDRPTSQSIYFHIRAVDGAGNWSSTTHYGPFWIDANAPTGSWITPLNNNYLRSTVNLEVSPNDVGSGVKHVIFKIKKTGGSFTTISTDASSPYQGILDTTTKTNGIYVLQAQIVDDVDRLVNKNINVTIDNTVPSSDPSGFSSSPTISTPTNDQTVNVAWTTGGIDALSGVDGYSYSFTTGAIDVPDNTKDLEETATNVTSTTLSDGTWYFHIRTVDNAGNWTSTAHYGSFIIETIVPTTTDTGTDTNWHNTDVTVILTCVDGTLGSGCDKTYYTTNGSIPDTSSFEGNTVVVSAEGITTIKYFSTDNAGNAETIKTAAHTVKIDKTISSTPVISAPNAEQAFKIVPILNQWSAPDDNGGSGVKEYQIKYTYDHNLAGRADTIIRPVSGTSRNHTPGLNEQDGVTIWVQAIDNAGNESGWSTSVHYYYDATAPVTIDSGTDADWHNTNVTVTLTCDDSVKGSGCDKTYYTTDGTTPTTSSSFGNSITLNTDGIYTIKYFSIDKAGNQESVKDAAN